MYQETTPLPHRDRILQHLASHNVARLSELKALGATATAVARLARSGAIVRLGRGLYQRADAPLDQHQRLIEVAKRVPKGVICLTSALAYWDLTDHIPRKTWVAIGPKDWRPRLDAPPIRFVRFADAAGGAGIRTVAIQGVPIRITDPARTIVDLFRYRRLVGDAVAIDGLREALRSRQAAPGAIMALARGFRAAARIAPYIQAFTLDG
jgi:predicted transcriptional regulator of viral defense system